MKSIHATSSTSLFTFFRKKDSKSPVMVYTINYKLTITYTLFVLRIELALFWTKYPSFMRIQSQFSKKKSRNRRFVFIVMAIGWLPSFQPRKVDMKLHVLHISQIEIHAISNLLSAPSIKVTTHFFSESDSVGLKVLETLVTRLI